MLTESASTEFLGIDFANLTYEEVALELDRLSRSETFSYVVTPNVDHIVSLHNGEDESIRKSFSDAYAAAALRICDSRILQRVARWRGIKLKVVTGSDLTMYLFDTGQFEGRKVVIIGGDDAMIPELRKRYPKINIAQHIPPMGVLRDAEAARTIEAFLASTASDYVLFAFGSPQSEIISYQCAQSERLRGVGLCIGASIDFLLGRKRRAPRWLQVAHLEWAFRMLTEPRRLGRRYIVGSIRFFSILNKNFYFKR